LNSLIEASLEGELDAHLETTRKSENNRHNGKKRKKSKAFWGALKFFFGTTARAVSHRR
jgi:hypothetical protein